MPTLTVGCPVPPFCLLDQSGSPVSNKDLLGKRWVIYFYPKASTPGCSVQACGIRDTLSQISQLNINVVGVSPDPVDKLKKFQAKYALNFLLLSDLDHTLAESFGVWQLKQFMGKQHMGVVRTTVILDERGKVEAVLDKFKTADHHEILLRYLSSHPL